MCPICWIWCIHHLNQDQEMQCLLSDCNSILLLGEANFSFSLSLKKMLPASVSMVTTCYQTEDRIPSGDAAGIHSNIAHLQKLGACVLFGVDATKLHQCNSPWETPYDAIIFNFPHVGGKGNIGRNRELLKQFFECCSSRLSSNGRILLTLCNGQGGTPADKPRRNWNDSWQAVAMATWGSFILTETLPFRAEDYEDYYCTGYRSQSKRFVTHNAITHVFERSRVPLDPRPPDLIPRELIFTLGSTRETVIAQCPPDLSRLIDRNLLSEPRHPLALISAELHRLSSECYPGIKVLKDEELPLVLPAEQVVTTKLLSPDELYLIDIKRNPWRVCSRCCDSNIGVPQGSVLGTTEEYTQLPLSPEKVKCSTSYPCTTGAVLSSAIDGGGLKISSENDGIMDKAVIQGGTSCIGIGTKQNSSSKASGQSRFCHCSEGTESSKPHVAGRSCENDWGYSCLSQTVKSNYILRPNLLSHVLGKEVALPIYACDRVYRRCGIGPGLYPITHQSLTVVPLSSGIAESWTIFKECICKISAGILGGTDLVAIEECIGDGGSIRNHTPLLYSVAAPEESERKTINIGNCGIFNSVKGDCLYCVWNLDTIAMIKYDVEDIRLFWSLDDRIFDKFAKLDERTSESTRLPENSFQGYSIHPPVYTHDLSFWLNGNTFSELDLCSVIRSVTSDLVREVLFLDQYINKKISYTFRLMYQSCDGALTKKAATQMQLEVRQAINKWLGLEPR